MEVGVNTYLSDEIKEAVTVVQTHFDRFESWISTKVDMTDLNTLKEVVKTFD